MHHSAKALAGVIVRKISPHRSPASSDFSSTELTLQQKHLGKKII
jgi:hypothetical protein